MRSARKKLAVLFLTIIACFCMATPVFAADNLTSDEISKIQEYLGKKAGTDGSLPANLGKYVSNESGDGKTPITYKYKDADGNEQTATAYVDNSKAGSFVNSATNDSGVVQDNVSDIISNVGLTANTDEATVMMSGITPIISLAVGIITWVVVIFLPIMSGLDILYLTVPFFREKTEEIRQNNMGGNNLHVKTTKNGETKIRWISDEAQHAVKFASYEDGKSPLTVYLMKRAGAYILIAIVLFIFLTGNIQILTQIAIKAVSGIMQVLGGLAGK